MTEGDDWKIQVSKKINGDLWNIRAKNAEDFVDQTEGLATLGDKAMENLGQFVQVVLAKGIMTDANAQRSGSESGGRSAPAKKTTAKKAGGVPSCAHGPMNDFADRNYRHRYYCTAKNRDEQCEPQD